MMRKINIVEAKYCSILRNEQNFAFCIEDPIDATYNPGYTVMKDSRDYETIIYEMQRAYQLIATKDFDAVITFSVD